MLNLDAGVLVDAPFQLLDPALYLLANLFQDPRLDRHPELLHLPKHIG
jgi:hypothetical protein